MSLEATITPRRSPATHFFRQNIGLVLAFVMLAAAIVLYGAVYWGQLRVLPGNFELTSTVDNTMPLIFSAMGQAIVVLTRGLDLSVGGIMDLSNALAAVSIHDNPVSMVGWSVVVLAVCTSLGLFNGVLVAIGRLQPILVTLATLAIYQGLAIFVLPQPGGAIPASYTAVLVNPNHPWALISVVALGLAWFAFRRSRLGVSVVAIGNDEQSARANGINIVRTKIIAYGLSGLLAGAAGLFLAATATAGDATTGNSYTLTSIVAAVLGGMNLFGGRGSGIGVIAGAFLVTMIINVLFFSNINPLYQSFYQGLFLVVAVVLGSAVGWLLNRRR